MSEGFYLAFDPGDTTGVAVFDSKGDIVEKGQYSFDKFDDWLHNFDKPVLGVICEEFKVFSHKASAFAGKPMVVSQVVGLIRSFARRRDIAVVFQPPTIKSTAEKWTGVRVTGPHSNSHWQDAFLHGAYYLIIQKIRKTALQQEYDAKREAGSNNA